MLTILLDWTIVALCGVIIGMLWHIMELRAMRRHMEREGYAGKRRSGPATGGRRWFSCLHRDKTTLRQL